MTPACPLCGGENTAAAFEKSGQDYWKCRSCTLLFARALSNANFPPSMETLEPAYRQYLDEGPADVLNLDDVIGWIESHVSLNDPEVRVLDVGAGSGKLVRRIRTTRQCEVSGVEPSTTLFSAYRLDGLGIEPVTLPTLASRGSAQFDVVTILDVLEHVPEAAAFLSALASVTKPDGFVFLSTPDANGVLARLLGRHWHHCNAYHFCLYGPQAIVDAARRHGFEVVALEHRSKRMPVGYLWNYARDFLLARRAQSPAYTGGHITIPVNLGDTLHTVWKRKPETF